MSVFTGLTRTALLGSLIWAVAVGGHAGTIRLHVATNGNDGWSGRLATPNAEKTDGPFTTIGRAREEIRGLKQARGLPSGGARIDVHAGLYCLTEPIELSGEDSGLPGAPIVYRAHPGEEVRLIGGILISGFRPVTEPAILQRLDEKAQGKVVRADLKALGITNYGTPAGGGLELFFGDKPMPLSRWPNKGFVH